MSRGSRRGWDTQAKNRTRSWSHDDLVRDRQRTGVLSALDPATAGEMLRRWVCAGPQHHHWLTRERPVACPHCRHAAQPDEGR